MQLLSTHAAQPAVLRLSARRESGAAMTAEAFEEFLAADAKNRAWRTLLQNLVFDVAAAVAVVLYTAFATAEAWGDFEWALLGFTLAKTVVVTALSYLMRRVFGQAPPQSFAPPVPEVEVTYVQPGEEEIEYEDSPFNG